VISATLQKIAHDLRTAAEEPEIDRDVVYLAVRRIVAQAEMLDEGLDEPVQVAL
jgi:hypothetical protein